MTRSGRAPPGGTSRLGRAVLAYLVVLIRLCGAETAIEHDELGGAVGILDGCDTAEVRPPAHLRDEIGTRGCDSHRALPQGHGQPLAALGRPTEALRRPLRIAVPD